MKKLLVVFTLLLTVGVLASCQAEGPLRVGMDLRYPPFETVDTMNNPEGISVEVAQAFGEFTNREVEIVNTAFGSLIPALEAGDIDIIIASMSITEERALKVDFTDPYFYFKIITLVNQDFAESNGITEDTKIQDLIDSEGRFTGIASQVSASIPAEYGINVLEAADLGTAVENVVQGTADILLMSANPVVQAYDANPNSTMIVWSPWVSSPIGMAVRKGDTELLDQANAFIDTFNEEGGLYDQLSASWDATILATLGRFGLEFYIKED
jgi:polar amino acid transport system substrate-binding protein